MVVYGYYSMDSETLERKFHVPNTFIVREDGHSDLNIELDDRVLKGALEIFLENRNNLGPAISEGLINRCEIPDLDIEEFEVYVAEGDIVSAEKKAMDIYCDGLGYDSDEIEIEDDDENEDWEE